MPWILFGATFFIAALFGFLAWSHGSFPRSAVGQILQGLLSVTCSVLIVVAFWRHGWKTGILELLLAFTSANIGWGIYNSVRRNLGL